MPAGVSAYVALANITLGSSVSSVSFSSINQGYKDLILVGQGTHSSSAAIIIRFNGDTASNYNSLEYVGDGSSGSRIGVTNNSSYEVGFFRTTISQFHCSIFDYSATDKQKGSIIRQDSAGNSTIFRSGRWNSTSAITSFVISVNSGTFSAGSTFALYGIAS